MTRRSWKPIRKVLVAAITALLAWVALRLGVDLGDAEVNQGAIGIVTVLAGYLTKTPRHEVAAAAKAEPTLTVVETPEPA